MSDQTSIVQQAGALPREARKDILESFTEKELHAHLKSLLMKMTPDALVEITHGSDEHGKDIVMVREDAFGRTVIAIVVKLGDIRAKTLGKIDEVISQVNQAIAHPAVLKAIVSQLTVSMVWVVLAGELSGEAHTRLEREVHAHDLKIFDLNWLIDKFTDHYPQVFFEGQVMDLLQQQMQELETRHIFCERGKTLSECFVDPIVALVDAPLAFDEEQFSVIVREKKMPFSRLASLVKTHKKLLLSGDPGTGKSVALAKLAIDMLRKASNQVIRKTISREIGIPLFVPAIQLLSCSTYEDLIQQYIPRPEIRDRFQITTVLVDGLDEVPPDRREEVLQKAGDFSTHLGSSLIVSSRKIDIIKSTPAGFEKYELLPFEFGQALTLFGKLITDSQVLDALKDGLDKIQYQIALTPLSLYLLIELAENHRELPASITELYDRFCDLVLGRYDKDKGIEVLFEYLIKKRFLAALAYKEFYGTGRLMVPEEDFRRFLHDHAKRYGWEPSMLQDFVGEIERAGVLELQNTVAFRHRSFLDYFVAQHIFDNRETFENLEDQIVQTYFDDVWSEVAFFYIGLRRDIRLSTLEKIFSAKGDGLVKSIEKLMAGRLLQAAWHATQDTKLYGITRAVAYALPTRERFLELAEGAVPKVPEFFADVFVMILSEYSFGSGFLAEETEQLFTQIRTQPSPESLYKMLSLLWSMQRFLEPDELKERIQAVLDTIEGVPDLGVGDESVALLMLSLIEKKDSSLAKTIRKRLKRLGKRYPHIFGDILPPGSRGTRKRKKRKKAD